MQNYWKITDRPHAIALLIVSSIAFGFFSALFLLNIYTDIQGHIEQVQAISRGELLRGNFLYYLVIWLLALGQTKSVYLALSSIVVLTLAVVAKFQISFSHLKKHTWAIWLSLGLIFAFSLPGPNYLYRGQIPPNIWHNSTTIFLMPAALLLFIESEFFIEKGKFRSKSFFILLVALNICIKPSFFFCIGTIFPLFVWGKYGLQKAFSSLLLPIGIGCLLVGLQYALTYYFDPANAAEATDSITGSGIQIAPLLVWRANSSQIWLSLLASLAFPITVVISQKSIPVQLYFPLALLAFGLLLYTFIAETGDRALHGNFAWQNIVCMYMLFLTCLKVVKWNTITRFTFALHVLAGIFYFVKILFTGNYF